MSKKFEGLKAWQRGKETVMLVYLATDNYPKSEIFALTSQTNRAAVSIIANIAEGSSRTSNKDYCHFLEISIGSAFELETLLSIAFERNYFDAKINEEIVNLLDETIKLTYGLKRKIYEAQSQTK